MSNINFCHISPTTYLEKIQGRKVHLVLAHLIAEDEKYKQFYQKESQNGSILICDNSGFEMFKRDLPMMEADLVLDLAEEVGAHYVVLSDFPGEDSKKTINKAIETIPLVKQRNMKTFFVPQSQKGKLGDYINACKWGFENCDLVGISILGAPLAFDCLDNKLQRFLSRWKILNILKQENVLLPNKIHMLGMLDGPNEIDLMKEHFDSIYSWDSSIAIQRALYDLGFDYTPTGCKHGKFEKEVDFNEKMKLSNSLACANINYIDLLCEGEK